MKQFKGTKGKWEIKIKTPERISISSENRRSFIDVWGVGIADIEKIEEVEANARLIASAPELLNALLYFLENGQGRHSIKKAEKAIEKALN